MVGDQISQLMGSLNANGAVYLVNPNGIVIGRDGVINAHRFVATTQAVDDDAFMAGEALELNALATGDIINLGTIHTQDGGTYLVGQRVRNDGEIKSAGTAALVATSERVVLFPYDDTELAGFGIEIELETDHQVSDISLQQNGLLEAVQARLASVGGDATLLLAKSSLSVANGASADESGDIYLTATGQVNLEGGINATDVTVLGQDIVMKDGASIDANADNQGGTVRIGGAFQGRGVEDGTTPFNADSVTIESGAHITANSESSGNGGQVIVWSDGDTEFHGEIEAKGATVHNQGGFVEVSGKDTLAFNGNVNTGGGTLLLDPRDIAITATGAGTNEIAASAITTALASNDVIIHTNHDDATTDKGHITVSEAIFIENSTNDLTLLAQGNITFEASLLHSGNTTHATAAAPTGTDLGGNINLVAGWDGQTGWAPDSSGTADGTDPELINNPTFSMADIIANDGNNGTTTSYGNEYQYQQNGSIIIGDISGTQGIAVGSRFGSTNVAAHGITIQAGRKKAYAQIGYASANLNNYVIDGDINVYHNGLLALTGSGDLINNSDKSSNFENLFGNYAKIGHAGPEYNFTKTGLNYSGDITVQGTATNAADVIRMESGLAFGSSAHIGHGSVYEKGNFSGDILVNNGTDLGSNLVLRGAANGTADASHAQIGHAANLGSGDYAGDITVNTNKLIMYGENRNTYSIIGHGASDIISAQLDDGNRAGNINITVADWFVVEDYFRLGHTTTDGQINDANFYVTTSQFWSGNSLSWSQLQSRDFVRSTISDDVFASIKPTLEGVVGSGTAGSGGSVTFDITGVAVSSTSFGIDYYYGLQVGIDPLYSGYGEKNSFSTFTYAGSEADNHLTFKATEANSDIELRNAIVNTADGDIYFSAARNFTSNTGTGSTPLSTANGRWIVYSDDPALNTETEFADADVDFRLDSFPDDIDLTEDGSATPLFPRYATSDQSSTQSGFIYEVITGALPTAEDNVLTTDQDTTLDIATGDFGFADTDGDSLNLIKITMPEDAGTLEYFDGTNWVDVTQDQEILVADLDAGNLRFTPADGENGSSYTTFDFQVYDGKHFSSTSYTITVDVTAPTPPPTDGGDTPTDGGDTPTDGGDTPTDGGDTPTDGGDTPTDGGDTPTDGGDTPTDGGDTPEETVETPSTDVLEPNLPSLEPEDEGQPENIAFTNERPVLINLRPKEGDGLSIFVNGNLDTVDERGVMSTNGINRLSQLIGNTEKVSSETLGQGLQSLPESTEDNQDEDDQSESKEDK